MSISDILAPILGVDDILGIDIGTYSVKIAQFKKVGNNWSLVNWGVLPLPEELQAPEVPIADKKKPISGIIKNFVSERKIKTKKAAISVAGSSVITRFVKFPKISKEELSKTIQFEAEPYIPFDIREVSLAFYILGDTVEEGQKKTEVVLVAAKKDLLQDRIDMITEAGLNPVVIDVDAFALENSYEINRDPAVPEMFVMVNMGANVTTMSVIENNITRVVRDIFYGGNIFNKALQKNLGCDFKSAETLKRKYGLIFTPEDREKALAEDQKEALQVSNILISACRDLLSEIHRSIDFFYTQRGEQQVLNRVLLAGGTACLKNIDKYFAQELKMPVDVFNPLTKVLNNNIVAPIENLPILSIAAGLAARSYKEIKSK
jgi:type IV pilus assembly protein PilM